MDVFLEKIVVHRKTARDYLYMAGVAAAVFAVIMAVIRLSAISTFVQTLWFLLMAGALYGGWLLIRRRNIEYEYAVTNGELDIDVIIDQKNRKRLFSQSCTEFERLAPYPEEDSPVPMRLYASSMDSPDLYAILTVVDKKRIKILFEPDSRMLAAFRQFIPRKILLRDRDRAGLPL